MIAAIVNGGRSSTTNNIGRAATAAAAAAGVSSARRGRSSEVRCGVCGPVSCVCTHVHASHHLLTLTNTTVTNHMLHQPCVHSCTDVWQPACRTPQAIGLRRGRREAAAEVATTAAPAVAAVGPLRLLQVAARRCRPLPTARRVGQHKRRACRASAACGSAQAGRAATPLAPAAGSRLRGAWPHEQLCEEPRYSPSGGSERAGTGRSVLPSHA